MSAQHRPPLIVGQIIAWVIAVPLLTSTQPPPEEDELHDPCYRYTAYLMRYRFGLSSKRLAASPLTIFLAAAWLHAQAPVGYHVGQRIYIPDVLREVGADGRFEATISRRVRSPQERRLLDVAERLYPDTAKLLGAALDDEHRARLRGYADGIVDSLNARARPAGAPADRWWFDRFDATWLPFAVTAGAVDYYLRHFRDLAAGKSPYGPPGVESETGSLHYTASVTRTRQHGATHVATLKLRWSYECGELCAIDFTHSRRVWFDRHGSVVRIDGDGRPMVGVS